MRGRVWIAALALLWAGAVGSGAAEEELDPLLEILIENGVITRAQAVAVEAERDRRAAAAAESPAEAPPEPAPSIAVAPEPPPAPPAPVLVSETTARWYDEIDFKADLRLRYEAFFVDELSHNDQRHRFRLRVRPGIYTDVTDWMNVGFQLRSGDPLDPVSDNQSTDGGFAMKQIAISEAFAGFHPAGWLDVTVGKFDPGKKWVVTDMQWDDDVTVEGAMEELSFGPLKTDLYQFLLEESKSGRDSYLLGGQLYAKLGSDSAGVFSVGAGFDSWVRPQLLVNLTLDGDLRGNKVTNLTDDEDRLYSDFDIFTGFAKWTWSRSERWPVKVHLAGYYNSGAAGPGEDYNRGFFARLQVGDYKEKYQPMFRYTRYYSEPDAIFYVFSQSDTTRASDVDGHRFDFRLGFVKRSYFNLTWYRTKPVYAEVPTMDRFQMDYIIRF
jgi:hypothetical protein